VLINDAHYAAASAVGRKGVVVQPNFKLGNPVIPRVLELIACAISAAKRADTEVTEPSFAHIQDWVNLIRGLEVELKTVNPEECAATRSENLALCAGVAGTRRFGNVTLTAGVNIARNVESAASDDELEALILDITYRIKVSRWLKQFVGR